MFRVTKTFKWEAAHQIRYLPEGHKCAQLHGHSYRAEVTLQSVSLSVHGFIRDVAELDPVRNYIVTMLDHRLGDLTTEQLAERLFKVAAKCCPETCCVRVYEGDSIWAEFEGGEGEG